MIRAAFAAALAVVASGLSGQVALASAHAHASRTLRVSDRGTLSGTMPGHARVDFVYNGSPNVTARFTIYAAGGSIYGQAHCRLHDPASPTPSFKGALRITGGSGRYAHAGGGGELYGVFHRRGYGLSVQATGELHV
jgi:hypothetical protein